MTTPPLWPWPPDDPRRFRRSLRGADIPPGPKGHDGKRTCRWCGGPSLAYSCSPGCAQEVEFRIFPQALARAVFGRDRGICALCGVDTQHAKRLVCLVECLVRNRFSRWRHEDFRETSGRRERFARTVERALVDQIRERLNWPKWRPAKEWEADHVVPVAEGGGGCGLDGVRTLCRACHGRETGALRRRLNARRRAEAAA